MNRDGRGHPGRYTPKNLPRLKLTDLLRRRRMGLKQLLTELGITTYEGLCIRCARLGVVSPTIDEFEVVIPPMMQVNSPQEGVIVLEPVPVIAEATGRQLRPGLVHLNEGVEGPENPLTGPSGSLEMSPKKSRKKKEGAPTE